MRRAKAKPKPSVKARGRASSPTPSATLAPVEVKIPGHWTSTEGVTIFPDTSRIDEFQALLNKTWRVKYTRDRKVSGTEVPSGARVLNVLRVENHPNFERYCTYLAHLRQKRNGDIDSFDVATSNCLHPLESGVNAMYLFHGTNPVAADAIARTDFRIDLAGSAVGTMFGPGLYLAENASKSDEYAKEGDGIFMGQCALLVVRAIAGKVFTTTEKGNFQDQVTSGEFDSICGDRLAAVGTFREMVFFDSASAYTEYIVLYSRLFEPLPPEPPKDTPAPTPSTPLPSVTVPDITPSVKVASVTPSVPIATDSTSAIMWMQSPPDSIVIGHRYDINDEWNMYGANADLGPIEQAMIFTLTDDGHLMYKNDEFMGVEVNWREFHEGGSMSFIRHKNQPKGKNGVRFKLNPDRTLSPYENPDLVIGFGKHTWDSQNKKPTNDGWICLMLVAHGDHKSVVFEGGGGDKLHIMRMRTPPNALCWHMKHELNDKWNLYCGTAKLGTREEALYFKFAPDGHHIMLLKDTFMGIEVGFGCHHEGSGLCFLRSKNAPEGQNGRNWLLNDDGTISAYEKPELVIGFGKQTWDSEHNKPLKNGHPGMILVQRHDLKKRVLFGKCEPSSEKRDDGETSKAIATSRYNDNYYCHILRAEEVRKGVVELDFEVHGDGSLGPLQDPADSTLGRISHPISYQKTSGNGVSIIVGTLTYGDQTIPTSGVVPFRFGSGGYSDVDVPISRKKVDERRSGGSELVDGQFMKMCEKCNDRTVAPPSGERNFKTCCRDCAKGKGHSPECDDRNGI